VIEARKHDVWKALTTPELIKQWFFGVDTETDWRVGSPLVHRGTWQGKPYEDKGEIEQFDAPHRLVHTHWSAMSGQPDEPANYQRVAWDLSERDGVTTLTVTEENLPTEQAKTISEQAWGTVLGNLKDTLEQPDSLRKTA
jgi:uncharacterized protein YndB with AHSA1/START domain